MKKSGKDLAQKSKEVSATKKSIKQKKQSIKPTRAKKWERSNDINGHRPLFDIICNFCEEKMMLRFTEIVPARNRGAAVSEGVNCFGYKCPRCHVVYKFFVPDEGQYLLEILLKRRDGIGLYLPPKEVWEKENEFIKKRLESLGYM